MAFWTEAWITYKQQWFLEVICSDSNYELGTVLTLTLTLFDSCAYELNLKELFKSGSRGQQIETILVNMVKPRLY